MAKKSKRVAKLEKHLNEAAERLEQADTLLKKLRPDSGINAEAPAEPTRPERPTKAISKGRVRIYWIAAVLVVLVVAGGALGLYYGLVNDHDHASDGVATSSTVSTTAQVSTATSAPTSISTTSTTTNTTASTRPLRHLGRHDFGRAVHLRVGEAVRIELQPGAGGKVDAVGWRYTPSTQVVVRQADSGAEVVGGVVKEAWLELEAATAGAVTVRGEYRYPDGSIVATWVVYLIVTE